MRDTKRVNLAKALAEEIAAHEATTETLGARNVELHNQVIESKRQIDWHKAAFTLIAFLAAYFSI